MQASKANGGEMGLELVWKFEMSMADSWYEPHCIVSIIDWAADGFIDKPQTDFLNWLAPVPKEPSSEFPKTCFPAKHRVHEYINLPSENNRTI